MTIEMHTSFKRSVEDEMGTNNKRRDTRIQIERRSRKQFRAIKLEEKFNNVPLAQEPSVTNLEFGEFEAERKSLIIECPLTTLVSHTEFWKKKTGKTIAVSWKLVCLNVDRSRIVTNCTIDKLTSDSTVYILMYVHKFGWMFATAIETFIEVRVQCQAVDT